MLEADEGDGNRLQPVSRSRYRPMGVESLFWFRLGSSQQRLVRIWLGPGEAPRSLDGALSYNREGLTYYVSLATLPFEWAVGVSL